MNLGREVSCRIWFGISPVEAYCWRSYRSLCEGLRAEIPDKADDREDVLWN